ncbi:MAG TPA: GspE/PulE family protein [Polyangiaceae bacterium]|jgi:general secretion pathway protein E|nr:GspE/PulE family protein [Polyangiaceae bacterium]
MAGTALHSRATLTLDYLCAVLEKAGLIANEQHREILVKGEVTQARLMRQRATGPRKRAASVGDGIHPAEVIVALGVTQKGDERFPLTERSIMQALALHFQLPYVDLDPLKIDAKLAPKLLSRPFARRHGALIIGADERTVTVAVADPLDHSLVDDLQTHVRREPRLVLSTPTEIQRLITDFYGFRGAVDAAEQQVTGGVDIGNLERYVKLHRVEEIEASDSHVVAAVEYLLHYALDQRASDVHIEPRRDHSAVRMRIDGVLHNVHTLPKAVHAAVVSRIKTLARLDIAEKRRPQDGRIKTSRGDGGKGPGGEREVEMRVSTIAVAFGEKLVLRIFDPGALLRDLPDIGLFEAQLAVMDRFLARPHGLILVTGPTGSGKTTTLYGALRQLATPEVNVVTIEDPIEIVVEAFNQVAVQPKIGFTFAEALRHVLRQDPDVIMVGEVRDGETASIALQAALTGHMVLATLHTNDAPSAITRLLELDVDPFVLSSTLVGVVGQRLVRTVCPSCRVETFLTADQLTLLGLDVHELRAQGQNPELQVAFGEGCVKCRSTGLLGRTGVFEVLEVDDKIRKLIVTKSASKEIMKQARHDGLMTLREAAIKKLARGTTSFEEVLRVTTDA